MNTSLFLDYLNLDVSGVLETFIIWVFLKSKWRHLKQLAECWMSYGQTIKKLKIKTNLLRPNKVLIIKLFIKYYCYIRRDFIEAAAIFVRKNVSVNLIRMCTGNRKKCNFCPSPGKLAFFILSFCSFWPLALLEDSMNSALSARPSVCNAVFQNCLITFFHIFCIKVWFYKQSNGVLF